MGAPPVPDPRALRAALSRDPRFPDLVLRTLDALVVALDPDGRIVLFNPACERATGWREDEVLGRDAATFLLAPEEVPRSKTAMAEAAAGRFPRHFEVEWMTRDGGRRRVSWNQARLVDEAGAVRFLVGCGIDLTERRAHDAARDARVSELLEASTPVVQVWEGVVLVPVIGTLDGARSERLMDRLLNAIVRTRSPLAILDITGVPVVDTETARCLVETVHAVRLLGARTILSGVRPAIAQTLVHLGIDLEGVETRASLVDALGSAIGGPGGPGGRQEVAG